MDDIIKEILEITSSEKVLDEALPLHKSQNPIPFSESYYKEIEPAENSTEICFIDGGNSEILGASNFSLQLVRVASATYKGKKKISQEVKEFRCLVSFKDGKFNLRTMPETIEFSLDSFDEDLKKGNNRISPGDVVGVYRRISELKLALESDSEIIILDGDLYPKSKLENKYLEKLRDKNAYGLSKTSRVLTKNGKIFSAILDKKGTWLYNPVFEGGEAETSFVKLHKSSSHVFRLDSFSNDLKVVCSELMSLSNDAVFPGYPYGLIEADRLARVSNSEIEYLKTKLMSEFGKKWRDVKPYLSSEDAHSILDNIG